MRSDELRIGYLGFFEDVHYQNFKSILSDRQPEAPILDISSSPRECEFQLYFNRNKEANAKVPEGAARAWSFLAGVGGKGYRQNLDRFFDQTGCNCIFGYWGTNVIPDLVAIKKHRPEVKVIWSVLCHPIALKPGKVALQNLLLRRSLHFCDGIVFSSNAMKRYFEEKVCRSRIEAPHVVMPPLLSRRYFAPPAQEREEGGPNLLFLGRMDWERGQPCDQVGDQLLAIMDQGIYLHHVQYDGIKLPFHPYRKLFQHRKLQEMVRFASRFDASLIYYNLDRVDCTDRFANTVPDRLIASISAGVPVVIPKKGYDACKEYLAQYGAFCEYREPGELKEMLLERDHMAALRMLAQQKRADFMAEPHFHQVLELLERV